MRRFPLVVQLAALVVFSVVSAGSAAASPTWQPATMLAPPQSSTAPRLAVDAKGDAVALWDRFDPSPDGGGTEVVLAAYRQAGADGWSAPVEIGTALGNPNEEVGLDGLGNATAAWTTSNGDTSNPLPLIVSSTRSAVTGRWSKPEDVTPVGSSSYGPLSLAVDSPGDAAIAWDYGYYFSYRPAGGRWQTSTSSPFVATYWQLVGAADGSMLLVGLDGDTVEAATRSGGNWSSRVVLGRAVDQYWHPVAAIASGGDAAVAWASNEHGNSIVYSAVRTGGVWQQSRALSFVDGNAYDPVVGIDAAGDTMAIWDTPVDVEGSFKPAGSSTWRRPVVVAAVANAAPFLAMNAAGAAVASWAAVYAKPVPAIGGSYFTLVSGWGPAQPLGTGGPLPNSAIGIDARGDGIAVWAHDETADKTGRQESLQSAVLDAGGPLLHAVYNHAQPRIIGSARLGGTLKCQRGVWSGASPIRFHFEWLRGRRAVGRRHAYRVTRSDVATRLSCRVIATNAFGSLAALSRPVLVRP